jgi:hypothetical protein
MGITPILALLKDVDNRLVAAFGYLVGTDLRAVLHSHPLPHAPPMPFKLAVLVLRPEDRISVDVARGHRAEVIDVCTVRDVAQVVGGVGKLSAAEQALADRLAGLARASGDKQASTSGVLIAAEKPSHLAIPPFVGPTAT